MIELGVTQVLMMGGGTAGDSKWAYTAQFSAGDFVHLTFTISAGRICGFVNGARSGDCSGNLLDGNRQLGTGEPLEVGGEDSYTNHVSHQTTSCCVLHFAWD